MLRWAVLALAMGLAAPAAARGFEGCAKGDTKMADDAITGSLELARRAAAAVGDTPGYATWFGAFAARHAEAVRATLKLIHAELAGDALTAVCLSRDEVDCKDTYAYVLYARPRVIHLCPDFFAMPSMAEAAAGARDFGNGTREGTIIHEMSHFPFSGGTEDHCYGRDVCADMALRDPRAGVENADSYQYFAEDVSLAWMAAEEAK